jgi:hypothetical protein
MEVKTIGIEVVRERAEFPPLEQLDELCEKRAKIEVQLERMKKKKLVKATDYMIDPVKRHIFQLCRSFVITIPKNFCNVGDVFQVIKLEDGSILLRKEVE